jgi:hypothetical protein
MRKKFLLGKKGDDPEWIQDISCYFFTYRKNEKSDEYMNELRELFLEYRRDGLETNEAWKKAKKVLDCFEVEKENN